MELKWSDRPLYSAAFSPDGKLIVTAGEDSRARVWDSKVGHFWLELYGHASAIFDAAFGPTALSSLPLVMMPK